MKTDVHIARDTKKFGFDLSTLGLKKEQIIICALVGSYMYGTATKDSDIDIFCIYVPTKQDIYLRNINDHMRYKIGKVDINIWSIHHFIKLLCNGDTLAIDILHAPYQNWLIYNRYIWPELNSKRKNFYTKDMTKFIDFSNSQAKLYKVKGERISNIEKVIEFLKPLNQNLKLFNIWEDLPTGKFINFPGIKEQRFYEICNRKFHENVKIYYILEHLEKVLTNYGNRAKIAKDNNNIDWKNLSNAIRIAEEVYWVLKYGEYKFPLKNRKFMKLVKMRKISFEMAMAVLNDYISEIERLKEKSILQKEINKEYWDKWLIELLDSYIQDEKYFSGI